MSDEQIQNLAFGKLRTHRSLQVQRHVFKCPNCFAKLNAITVEPELAGVRPRPLCVSTSRKPLSLVHDTADGFIYSKVERRGRKWMARHWGDQLDGIRECFSMREANEYVVRSFAEMFPEHRCTERCKINPQSSL